MKERVCDCAECIYNIEASTWPGNRLPCGQFACWYDLTPYEEDEEEAEDEDEEVIM